MSNLVIELPPKVEQDAFNRLRWEELSRDPELAKIEKRIETDRYGYVVMSPYASGKHGSFQGEIGYYLRKLMPAGRAVTECPISTSDGVKLADVSWFSAERISPIEDELCFSIAPEICVEVISPSNTKREIEEKRALYFEAGAQEFWTCSGAGKMLFFPDPHGEPIEKSIFCPEFPGVIDFS